MRSRPAFFDTPSDDAASPPSFASVPSLPAPKAPQDVIVGTSGNDNLTGTSGDDFFNLNQGGNDTASGLGGDDQFAFGTHFTAADHINGGAGYDALILTGKNYTGSSALLFAAATMKNVEEIDLDSSYSYKIATNDANVAAGRTLIVNALLHAGQAFAFDGSAETDGNFIVNCGSGTYTLTGGAGDDQFVFKGNGFTAADKIDGGGDTVGGSGGVNATGDELGLDGDYSAGVVFNATTITNIETIGLAGGFSYNLTTNDANVAAGHSLAVDGTSLGSGDHLHFNGSAETNGTFFILGGDGSDTLVGGAGADVLAGGEGADHLTGGGGPDKFLYGLVSQSTGAKCDTITGFDFKVDRIVLGGSLSLVTGINANVVHGSLSSSSFDTDLAAAIGSTLLGKHHAVTFTPDSGSLKNDIFLIIDENGEAGYQAGQDLVIRLVNPVHFANITTADFIPPG